MGSIGLKTGSWALVLLLATRAHGQGPADTLVGLKGLVESAAQRYHAIKAGKLEVDAAQQGVEVAKYSRMPMLDVSYQAGIGTANNLTGIFYPGDILPMTGPPSTRNNYSPGTGSAASLLLNWQAATFGARNAQIDASIAEAGARRATWEATLFDYKIRVISVYLDVLLAADIVQVQRSNIERSQALLRESRFLSRTGVRPGVDTALLTSELSKSRVGYLQAQQQLKVTQLTLGQLIGTDGLPIAIDTAFIEQLPPGKSEKDTAMSGVPFIREGESQVQLSEARERALHKSFLPKLNVWGTGFARGSGFQADGTLKTWDGLGLSRYNYGAGVSMVFPILKYGEVRRQSQAQAFLSDAAREQLEERRSELTSRQRIAVATLENSMAVAGETDVSLGSGRYAYNAMRIRYNTGLATYADLIQSQYGLLKAELDRKQAYWQAWKALLLKAAVLGDEKLFLQAIK